MGVRYFFMLFRAKIHVWICVVILVLIIIFLTCQQHSEYDNQKFVQSQAIYGSGRVAQTSHVIPVNQRRYNLMNEQSGFEKMKHFFNSQDCTLGYFALFLKFHKTVGIFSKV